MSVCVTVAYVIHCTYNYDIVSRKLLQRCYNHLINSNNFQSCHVTHANDIRSQEQKVGVGKGLEASLKTDHKNQHLQVGVPSINPKGW